MRMSKHSKAGRDYLHLDHLTQEVHVSLNLDAMSDE